MSHRRRPARLSRYLREESQAEVSGSQRRKTTFVRRASGQRVISALVAASLLVGCGYGTDDGQETSAEELADRAAGVTDQLGANDWAAIRKDFDETMTEALSEEGLRQAWEQVVAAQGEYKSRDEPVEGSGPGDITAFDTPMTFERGDMKSRVSFHPDGRIAGLFILVPEAP